MKDQKKETPFDRTINDIRFQLVSRSSTLWRGQERIQGKYWQYILIVDGKIEYITHEYDWITGIFLSLVALEEGRKDHRDLFLKTKQKWAKIERCKTWTKLIKVMKE